jgi:hypothetical protein
MNIKPSTQDQIDNVLGKILGWHTVVLCEDQDESVKYRVWYKIPERKEGQFKNHGLSSLCQQKLVPWYFVKVMFDKQNYVEGKGYLIVPI